MEYVGKGKAVHPSGQDSQVRQSGRRVALRQCRRAQRQDHARPRPDCGLDEHHREGSYYFEWYEHGKRYRKAVADFATVTEAARLKAIEVEALKAGVMSRPAQPTTINTNGVTLTAAVDRYLAMVEAQRSHRTYTSYRYTLKKGWQ